MKNVYGKYALVTGASSGIGQAVARELAGAGMYVTGVSRHCDMEREEFESGGYIDYMKMDVTDPASVKAVTDTMNEIDVAVLSAGSGVAGPVEELPLELAKKQMDVNYFGALNVCHQVLPVMRRQRRGIVIAIGSVAGRIPIPMQSHYSSSKYALEALIEAVRMEMHDFGVRAVLIEPGDTKTGFTQGRQCYDDTGSVYSDVFRRSVNKMAHDEQHGSSPEGVARTALKLLGKKNPPVRVTVGFIYKAIMVIVKLIPARAMEFGVRMLYLPKK